MIKQTGYLIIVVALLLIVIGGLTTSFVSMMTSGTNSSSSTISANSAYFLAYSGIEDALYQLSISPSNCSSSGTKTLNNQGEYQYSCSPYNSSSNILSNPITGLSNNATTISLISTNGFADFGSIQIDSEIIYYDGNNKNSNTLLNAIRGRNGTTASAHSANATVTQSLSRCNYLLCCSKWWNYLLLQFK